VCRIGKGVIKWAAFLDLFAAPYFDILIYRRADQLQRSGSAKQSHAIHCARQSQITTPRQLFQLRLDLLYREYLEVEFLQTRAKIGHYFNAGFISFAWRYLGQKSIIVHAKIIRLHHRKAHP